MTSRSLAWVSSRCQVIDKRNSVEVRNAGEKGRTEGEMNGERGVNQEIQQTTRTENEPNYTPAQCHKTTLFLA